VIEYQYPRVKNSLGRDVWITAVELHPGERSVLHHLIANEPVVVPAKAGETSEQRLQRERNVQRSSGSLAGFAPGMLPIVYSFAQPKVIPAGSQLVWDFAWDNSRQNRANPNPDIPVRWGDQTFEEMGIGFIRFRYLDEEVGKAAPAAQTSAR
jgi:hypothetical protein